MPVSRRLYPLALLLLLAPTGRVMAQSSYSYYRAIAIDHTKVPNTDQSNFPVLVSGTYSYLATVANGGRVSSANGYDIIFTSDPAGTTQLSHEIDTYDPATGTVNLWVKIPTLSHTSDTTIYLWYGNSSITSSQERITDVWSNGYKGVWHFGGSPLSVTDSTGINPSVFNNGATPVPGKLGGAASASPGQYIDFGSPLPSVFDGQNSVLTISYWANDPSANSQGYGNSNWGGTGNSSDSTNGLRATYGDGTVASGEGIQIVLNNGGDSFPNYKAVTLQGLTGLETGWHYASLTLDVGTLANSVAYLDGNGTGSFTSSNGAYGSVLLPPSFDAALFRFGSNGWQGAIDEYRISTVARSSDWVATEYANQNSPATFYTVSGENSIAMSPATVTLCGGQSQQFSVSEAGAWSGTTTFSLNPSLGAITATGLYTAPAVVPSATVVTVTASVAGWGGGTATITLLPPPPATVNVAPVSATLYGGQTQQFTATVTNASDTGVTWSLSPNVGSISGAGLYTAPANIGGLQTITVTATSVADPTTSATASVTLNPPPYFTYSYYRAITIDHTKVPNTDQANFPVLISGTYPYLATVANGGQVQNANGYDVGFTADAAGTSKLNYEVESYNPATGAIVAWVQVPTVSHTTDTVIYLQYGNSIISLSQENKTGVWDANYQGVWHLGDGTTLSAVDSTANANDGSISSVVATSGKIGGAAASDGGHIDAGDGTSLQITNAITIEAWINANQVTGNYWRAVSKFSTGPYSGYELLLDAGSGRPYLQLGAGSLNVAYGAPLVAGAWTHVVGTYDGTTLTTYVNGSAGTPAVVSGALANTSSILRFFDATFASVPLDGDLDEVRISSTARSADWIATEYNNQNSPGTFYTVGSADGLTLSLTPTSASLSGGQTQQFTATVTNASDTDVTWGLSPNVGSISSAGLYTAPANVGGLQTITVTATSAADPTTSATASVTLNPPPYFTYSYYRAIAIDHTKVPNTDQANFPVLISGTYPYLATVANGGQVQNSSGYDIVFTSDAAGTSKLNYEVESYNAATGAIVAWVQVPTVSHTTDTVIYLQYGNSIISVSQQNRPGTWDSNFQMVLHLDEPAPPYNDSTVNAYSSTGGVTPTAVAGKVGGGQSFDGVSQYIAYSQAQSPNPTGSITLETWIKTTDPGGKGILGKWVSDGGGNADQSYQLFCYPGGAPGALLNALDGGDIAVGGGTAVNDGNWHHVAVTAPPTGTIQVYIDGAPNGSLNNGDPLLATTADRLLIGATTLAAGAYYTQASLDEVRMSNAVRSADWIAAEYNNENSPATFYSVSGGGGLTLSLTPATASLSAGQTQQFTATVTNASNTGVTWSLSPGVGTLSSAGLYTAPATIASQQTVAVTATSLADGVTSATATVTLYPPVTIAVAPITASLSASQAQQFTATVANAGNTAVTWSLNPNTGTVDGTGLYTAPSSIASQQTVTVTATSAADSTKTASAAVTLVPSVTVSVAPLTAALSPSQTQQFTAIVANAANTAVTWSVSPATGTIGSSGLYTAPSAIASQQSVTVTATSVADTTKSASATVTLSPMPTVSGLSSGSGTAGAQIVVSGSGFGPTQGTGSVWLGSTPGTVISWSDTQITATVASNAVSGSAYVQQWGLLSNAMPFTISTATITGVAPAMAAPGASVTISGSGFGASQGTGQAWLGGAIATIQSWSDGQIVAQVAAGATGTGARVLQNGVMSNAGTFTVDALLLTGILPTSGSNPPSFTFTGAGFGTAPGIVWLGDRAGNAVSWTDTQVVATADPAANSGVAKIQQNGVWSNAKPFIVSVPFGGGNTVVPSVINMVVGDTRSIQALNSSSQPVTGLTWTSSNPNIVSLSTDNPPVLTALAPGNVTITAGTGSADVTVSAVSLPLGTVIWSNPGNGSGVTSIVPAVPSASGVADVFAFQNDGTVQAIASDGTTAWTADINNAWWSLPDFQGGLVVADANGIRQLDGTTGQAHAVYPLDPQNPSLQFGGFGDGDSPVAVHTDGTIFAMIDSMPNYPYAPLLLSVVGLDPTTGAQKFSVPVPADDGGKSGSWTNGMMIAGDGYAYVAYTAIHFTDYYEGTARGTAYKSLMVLRIGSSGAYDAIDVYDWTSPPISEFEASDEPASNVHMITNEDTGILITWSTDTGIPGMAITTGTSATVLNTGPVVPGQSGSINPVLQAQDGSFIGSVDAGEGSSMVAFDASGNVRWVVPELYMPKIATADGGFVAQAWDSDTNDYTGPALTFDSNGNATGMLASLQPDWAGQLYGPASSGVSLEYYWLHFAASFWPVSGAEPSGVATSVANLGLSEGLPLWFLSGPQSCGQVGTNKIALGGEFSTQNQQAGQAVLQQYNTVKQQLLTILQTASTNPQSACARFFTGGAPVGTTVNAPLSYYWTTLVTNLQTGSTTNLVVASVTNQTPYDGPLSNLSMLAAGAYVSSQLIEDPVPKLGQYAVCQSFWSGGSWSGTVALAQSQPPGTDVYIATQKSATPNLTQSTILHEALHNLTGLSDEDLYRALTGTAFPKGSPTSIINKPLVDNGCAVK